MEEKKEISTPPSEDVGVIDFMGSYELGETLYEGNYCTIKHATQVATGQKVAVKIIDKEKVLRDKKKNVLDLELIERNVSTMKTIRHPNVVHIYEVISTETQLCLIMELATDGKLFDKIKNTTTGRLTEPEARKYFQQLIYAVAFCHNNGITHRNLKVESVNGYDYARADVWACGVILFAMLTGDLPFNNENIGIIYLKACAADFSCPSFLSPTLKRLIRRILDPNPAARITIVEMLKDEWFDSNNEDELISNGTDHVGTGQDAGPSTHQINNAYDDLRTSPSINFEVVKRVVNVLARRKRVFRTSLCGSKIISRFEKPIDRMNLHTKRIDMVLEGGYGPKFEYLSVKVKITPSFYPYLYRVTIRKNGGDARDFDKFYKELIDEVEDIIWNEDNIHLPSLAN
ncbi:hypothetical protein PHAVU_002G179600 [Phaseolus vulgaris]|uniref:Protein kinase domain-containing protein n=1 Tax=Phaseolus vulgaris TaxID=3885 RepID=V7CKP6_PHAVU|nr:hypothetical protein PHAVU_002G179600g [Phaseolus vulgaris]ESW30752.1 hypothetical protein PHAVU_002G179600g [Phaseolus vulgaris]